jgi:hypothetical protein
MIDQAKVSNVRTAIRDLASEYDRSGVPDVAKTLREIADLSPYAMTRLRELMKADVAR